MLPTPQLRQNEPVCVRAGSLIRHPLGADKNISEISVSGGTLPSGLWLQDGALGGATINEGTWPVMLTLTDRWQGCTWLSWISGAASTGTQ